MRRSIVRIVVALVLVAIAVCYWQWGSLAVGERRAGLSVAEDRAAQLALMDQASKPKPKKPEKPKPVVWKHKIACPIKFGKRSAAVAKAKTAISLDQAWSCTMDLLNYTEYGEAPVTSIGVTGTWGAASLTYVTTFIGQPMDHPVVFPPDGWEGYYTIYRLQVDRGPGHTDSQDYAVWSCDHLGAAMVKPAPPYPVVQNAFSASVACTFTGIYLKGERENIPASNRQPMDWSDYKGSYSWYAGADATVTVTATGPDSTTVTTTAGFDDAGSDLGSDLGTAFYLYPTIVMDGFPTANTIYARIGALTWTLVGAIDLSNLSLWYSASEQAADRAPYQISAATRHWSRFEEDASAEKIHVLNSGGIAIRREGTGDIGVTSQSCVMAPYSIAFKFHDGRFATETPYEDISYEIPANVWTES